MQLENKTIQVESGSKRMTLYKVENPKSVILHRKGFLYTSIGKVIDIFYSDDLGEFYKLAGDYYQFLFWEEVSRDKFKILKGRSLK